jgi:hypothetical protein
MLLKKVDHTKKKKYKKKKKKSICKFVHLLKHFFTDPGRYWK